MGHRIPGVHLPLVLALLGAMLLVGYAIVSVFLEAPGTGDLRAWLSIFAVALAAGAFTAALFIQRARSVNISCDGKAYIDTVRTLTAAIDTGDPFALGRGYRVSQYALVVGRRLSLSPIEMRDLELAALLHDIGRTAIEREVLQKTEHVDADERHVMRSYPRLGYEILKRIDPLQRAAEVVLSHHEQPDGRGHPRGLSADRIPVESRIIHAVVVFDTMTCDRPYRTALDGDQALAEMRRHSGTHFFPEVLDALTDAHQSGDLYAGINLRDLARYSSGLSVSKAIEDYIQSHNIPWGAAKPADAGSCPDCVTTEYEIELPAEAVEDADDPPRRRAAGE